MIAIIDKNDESKVTPMMLEDDAWFVTHAYNGVDTVEFTISDRSEYYGLFEEESEVLVTGLRGDISQNRFVIKNIDSHDGIVTVSGSINLYDWQREVYEKYLRNNVTLQEVLNDIMPDTWSAVGQGSVTARVDVKESNGGSIKGATPLGVLDVAATCFGCVFNFDSVEKKLYCIVPDDMTPTGDFLSDEVNVRSVGYVGNTETYATRLYPYGSTDEETDETVTIESVNGGVPYIEDHSFSNDIIAMSWTDERYSIPEHLLEAAKEKLAQIAVPARSYEVDVSQLDRKVWLYMVLTMVDRVHGTRIDQQVVEWREYGRPDLDVVTLSATPPSLESIVSGGLTQDDVQDAIDSNNDWIQGIIQDAIDNATDAITGNDGGYFKWVFDQEGRPIELVNLGDSLDINDAKQVWRWNAAGLGHSSNGYNGPYTMAMLADGSINASMITTGILNASLIQAGTMNADLIRTGRIEAKDGDFWFDLDSGEMYISTLDVEIQNGINMRVPQIVQQQIDAEDIPGQVEEQMYTLIRLTSSGVEVGTTANDVKSVVGPGMFKLSTDGDDYMRMYPSGTPTSGQVYFMMPYGTGFEFQTQNAARFIGETGGYSFSSEVSHISAHTVNSVETWHFTPSSSTGSFNYDFAYPDSLFLDDIEYLVIYYYVEYNSQHGKAGSLKIKISQGETREALLVDTVLLSGNSPQQITSTEGMLVDMSSSSHDIIVTRYGAYRASVNKTDTIGLNTNPGTIFRIYNVNVCK